MSESRILVVDDDPNILFAFHALLEKAGYKCIEARTGTEALKKFNKKNPQAVFLDISLPDLNGLNVLKEMKNQNHSIPVIMMTSSENEELSAQALQEGAYLCIKKPLSINRIREILKNAMK